MQCANAFGVLEKTVNNRHQPLQTMPYLRLKAAGVMPQQRQNCL